MNFIEAAPAVRSICTLHELETNHPDLLLSPGKTICIGCILVEDKRIERRVIWGFCAQEKLRKRLAIAGGEREIGQVTNSRYVLGCPKSFFRFVSLFHFGNNTRIMFFVLDYFIELCTNIMIEIERNGSYLIR